MTIEKTASNTAAACVVALSALHRLPYPLNSSTASAERFAIMELLNILNTTAKALHRIAESSYKRTSREG